MPKPQHGHAPRRSTPARHSLLSIPNPPFSSRRNRRTGRLAPRPGLAARGFPAPHVRSTLLCVGPSEHTLKASRSIACVNQVFARVRLLFFCPIRAVDQLPNSHSVVRLFPRRQPRPHGARDVAEQLRARGPNAFADTPGYQSRRCAESPLFRRHLIRGQRASPADCPFRPERPPRPGPWTLPAPQPRSPSRCTSGRLSPLRKSAIRIPQPAIRSPLDSRSRGS